MSTLSTKPVRNEDRRSQRTIPFIPPPSRETSFQHTYVTLYNTVVSLGPFPQEVQSRRIRRANLSDYLRGTSSSPSVLDGLLLFSSDELCVARIRCDAHIRIGGGVGGGRKRNRDYVSRFESWFAQFRERQTEREREREEWAKRKLFMRPAAVYAVSFESNSWFPRSMLARYVDGWIRAICTKHSRRIDNSHDRRDESAGITLRDEFASVNLARISQTRDTYTLTVIESSMRRITLSNYTHGNFLFRPPSPLS